MYWDNAEACGTQLSELAVNALVEEAELTPKPGLVDRDDSGAHQDLNFGLMVRSADSLKSTFADIGSAAFLQEPNQELREKIALIGRVGEKKMFEAVGTNTHKGAIWALGLLVASAAVHLPGTRLEKITGTAGEIACFTDRKAPEISTNGSNVQQRFGVKGAREEAQQGFPHVIRVALPVLQEARQKGMSESMARLEALIQLISHVDDTCILHRGGIAALSAAKMKSKNIIQLGGVATAEGWEALSQLEQTLLKYNASPGGSADLLAAALFLDRLEKETSNPTESEKTNVILV
ncbi:triphosphoribosyl-dephospho-CoA synthase [Thalassobacillus cyri]|uniref:triphosphoribosyl-dephospho-CoA synthase n=1 Tax=Thalassobacillus cyri TaxID=571932 RepID=A0A1H4AJS4_9BACI|nr:triphosphoribosyl-dephospho-CoA synthase [Thalassobacillus cyri]SEA35904.1 triphosphoribosyl-dephospho-CoA synthase [Thalassobacillus cyri]